MREQGYIVTIKAFIPSPKNDFQKQADAAALMAAVTKANALTPEFLDLAKVTKIDAKYGSADLGAGEAADGDE